MFYRQVRLVATRDFHSQFCNFFLSRSSVLSIVPCLSLFPLDGVAAFTRLVSVEFFYRQNHMHMIEFDQKIFDGNSGEPVRFCEQIRGNLGLPSHKNKLLNDSFYPSLSCCSLAVMSSRKVLRAVFRAYKVRRFESFGTSY